MNVMVALLVPSTLAGVRRVQGEHEVRPNVKNGVAFLGIPVLF